MVARRASWLSRLAKDPRPVLLASDEPFARFVALTAIEGLPESDRQVRAARRAVLADAGVKALVGRLPKWDRTLSFGGHHSPGFPPNLLRLLHGLGVRAGDFAPLERILDEMLRHQADDGRFLTPGGTTGRSTSWASLPCDHFAILEVLLLFDRANAAPVQRALARVRETYGDTAQGRAWLCIPDPVAKWRGPGRKGDACLQVTVEALRLFSLAPPRERPRGLGDAVATLLGAWHHRREQKPYFFGHGPRFIAGKWPPTWYDASAVLEAIAPFAKSWKTPAARPRVKELLDGLASNFGPDGLVTPRSCFRGFEDFSFGQKDRPSHWATARACGLLCAFG